MVLRLLFCPVRPFFCRIGLLTLDVRLRRLGPLTALGMLGFVGGSLLLFVGVADAIDVSPWLIWSFAVAALLYWGFGLTVAVQSRERLTSTQRGMVGLVTSNSARDTDEIITQKIPLYFRQVERGQGQDIEREGFGRGQLPEADRLPSVGRVARTDRRGRVRRLAVFRCRS